MAYTMALMSGDGGVGKTLLVASLGARLVASGRKALVIDCNAGFRALDMMLSMESRVMYDSYDATSGNCSYEDAIIHGKYNMLPDLLAAPFDATVPPDDDLWSKMLESLKANYDFIALDTPTGCGAWSMMASRITDNSYIVLTPVDQSMRCAERMLMTLRTEGHSRTGSASLIINRMKMPYIASGIHYPPDVVAQTLDARVTGVILEDESLGRNALRASLNELDPGDAVVRDLDALARRTMGAPRPKSWALSKPTRFPISSAKSRQTTLMEVWT